MEEQVKIFSSSTRGEVEKEVNHFLWDKPAHFVDIKYTTCVDDRGTIYSSALIIYRQG